MKKHIIWVVLAIIVLAAGGWYIFGRQKGDAVTYTTGTVTKGTLVISVSASGTTSSANRNAVTTAVSGTVKKVYVKDGDAVRAGQTLMTVTLDRTGTEALQKAKSALVQAKGALTAALQGVNNSSTDVADATTQVLAARQEKVQLKQAFVKATDDRDAAQTAFNAVSGLATTDATRIEKSLALQAAKAAYNVAKSKYANADAQIAQAENGIQYVKLKVSDNSQAVVTARANVATAQYAYDQATGTITAPVAGTIGDLIYTAGMPMTSSSSGTGATSGAASTKVASVITETLPVASFSLAQTDEPNVRPGQKATLMFDALTDQTFIGTVIGVDRTGTSSSGVTTYPMTIQLDAANDAILPNMSVTASVITKTVSDVLLVPSAAVKSTNGGTTVQVMKDGVPSTVTVEIGDSSDSQTVITSGLTEGQTVVTATISNKKTTNSSTGTTSLFGGTTSRNGAARFETSGAAVQVFQAGPPN